MIQYMPMMQGFFSGAGLIVAIGAQNAFVLKQGLRKQHVFVTALFCALIDTFLILMGVAGFGKLIEHYPFVLTFFKWGGMVFLVWYGSRSFVSALSASHSAFDSDTRADSLKHTLSLLTAFTLLNPHVYLDTVVFLGSLSSHFQGSEKILFASGAVLASFTWFFSLSYGSKFLAPYLNKPMTWKVLDFSIACMMWSIAFSLFYME